MTRFVVVTGTDTGVGKTIATAALAASARRNGARVAVVKPVQTGLAAGARGSDMDVVRELTGLNDVHELVRLSAPLAPDTAARLEKRELPAVGELALQAVRRTAGADVVLIEGAGGVRVRLDSSAGTLLDLASELARSAGGAEVSVVVVVRAGLGTLNHTDLTVGAVRTAQLPLLGLIVGSWPSEPDLAARCNLEDLATGTGLPILGLLPAGCGQWPAEAFASGATDWLGGWDGGA
jgi:dethiobiotin synthetase